MIDKPQLIGRRLALLLMSKDEQGDDDWAVCAGAICLDAQHLVLEGLPTPLELDTAWIQRIRPVPTEVREILLECDYYVALTVGDFPDGANSDSFTATGLKWPAAN